MNIKSMVKPNFLHGKMYHIKNANRTQKAIFGSSNFTVSGLGFGNNPNIELNMEVDSDRDRIDLSNWFNEIWNDDTGLVEDVKDEVLKYLSQLYQENSQALYIIKPYTIFSAITWRSNRVRGCWMNGLVFLILKYGKCYLTFKRMESKGPLTRY